eukprot:jgi/Tetstr1/424464/TSEL_014993.t1
MAPKIVNDRATTHSCKRRLARAALPLFLILCSSVLGCVSARPSRHRHGEEAAPETSRGDQSVRRTQRNRSGAPPAGDRRGSRDSGVRASPPGPAWLEPYLDLVETFNPKLQRLNWTSNCIRRTAHSNREQENDANEDQAEEVGVVLVITNQTTTHELNSLGCRGGKLGYYIFVRARNPDRVMGQLQPISRARSAGRSWTTSPGPHVTSEYLHYIAHRYFALPKTVVFAEVPADLSGLPAALDDAFEGVWMYKPFEHRREPLDLGRCAHQADTCNDTQFQKEIVSMFSRFTCDGQTCARAAEKLATVPHYRVDKEHVCMLPHVHRSFIVSAERLQRVARVEYVWMSLWLQSWQEVARDRLFDNLAARVWPLLLGCPHMAHFGEQAGFHGCVGGMEQRPGPRHELHADPDQRIFRPEVVSLPKPKELLDPRTRLQYMRMKSLRSTGAVTAVHRRITFAVTCGETPPGGMTKLSSYLAALLATALLKHPGAQLVVLVRQELEEELRRKVKADTFDNRLEVVPLHPRSRDPWFGVDAGQEVEPENDRWAYMHWFPLVQQWLEKLPISGRGSGAGEYGHLVFLPANSVVTGDLWPLFERPFSLGFPAAGPGSHFPEGLMLVHQWKIWQADLTMRMLAGLLQDSPSARFHDLVRSELLTCPQSEMALVNGQGDTRICSALGDFSSIAVTSAVKMIECGVWEGRPTHADPPTVWQDVCSAGPTSAGALLQQVYPATTSRAWQAQSAVLAAHMAQMDKDREL